MFTMKTKQDEVGGGPFAASASMSSHLQQILVDLIGLQLQAKQAHWSVVGPNFRDLHLEFDEVSDAAREGADAIAERMRSLGAVVDGQASAVAATARLVSMPSGELGTSRAVELITGGLSLVTADIRRLHDEIDAEDPATTDILHGVVIELEKLTWMLSAENRGAFDTI